MTFEMPEALKARTPETALRARQSCKIHTEHARRGDGRYGRSFPQGGPDAGIWDRCVPTPESPAGELDLGDAHNDYGNEYGGFASPDYPDGYSPW